MSSNGLVGIPNNVELSRDRVVRRSMERWRGAFRSWWRAVGPRGFQFAEVYLRSTHSAHRMGWYEYLYRTPSTYPWGIWLADAEPGRVVGFGDHLGEPAWQEVPRVHRSTLCRLLTRQADLEAALVEQTADLGYTSPSNYDLRNLIQVQVDEARHVWAMAYLLQAHLGREGRNESEELLERRSGDLENLRLARVSNLTCPDWLALFCLLVFTDRFVGHELSALAESGFDPLARTCSVMHDEEASHLTIGEQGILRVLRRTVELMRRGEPRELGGIDLPTIQRYVNHWYSTALDHLGTEVSTSAAEAYSAGLRGRIDELERWSDHLALGRSRAIPHVKHHRMVEVDVPLRQALNEQLRDDFEASCEAMVRDWNQLLADAGVGFRFLLPHRRFNRTHGLYAGHPLDPAGVLVGKDAWMSRHREWLPSQDDLDFVSSLMVPAFAPGSTASWIAPPERGIDGKPADFEYVRLSAAAGSHPG